MQARQETTARRSPRAAASVMRDLSLKQKLIAIIMLTCVAVLLLAGAIFIAWEWTSLRHAMVRDLSLHANVLASNCRAPMTSADAAEATEILSSLSVTPSIVVACIYTHDGRLFASYIREGTEAFIRPQDLQSDGHTFSKQDLTLFKPIVRDDETLGTIALRSNLDPLVTRLQRSAIVISGIVLLSSLAAYLVSSRLQRVISTPILHLAEVANVVSEKRQYAVRAEQHSNDEVGRLIQAFNEMLEQIQRRDCALVNSNEQLEARVRERTTELTTANERLTREVAFRKKAEELIRQRTERIIRHQRTLLKLSTFAESDVQFAFQKITEEVAETLAVGHLSVWLFNERSGRLVCKDLFTRDQGVHVSGLELDPADYPACFEAIETDRILAAGDARQDPRTQDFVERCRAPLAITAMMAVSIRLHGQTLGILCLEHTGDPREWSLEEQDFAASIADMIALQIEANERRKAERALAKANEHLADTVGELRRSNRELQDFAYVTAHDLKAPLRGIGTLADWLTADYASELDDTGQQHLGLLKSRVSRMSELIEGILHYSEIGKGAKHLERIDLNGLISEVIAQLDVPETMEIHVEKPLPVVVSERIRLTQVFQNLIGNAIKYMDKPPGRIQIRAASEAGLWQFSVTDNGPGIQEKYFEKIFKMFQTLTRRDEVESTGIGLAIVKKIADLYGGRVWVESTAGEGTTFFFALPKRQLPSETEQPQTNAVG